MTEQTEKQAKIPSRTLTERILELAGDFEREPFGPNMFDLLSKIARLRFNYIQNCLSYSVAERRDVSELLEQVDKLYDDQLQIARNREYHRLLGAKVQYGTRG